MNFGKALAFMYHQSMKDNSDNPFRPGSGTQPPYRAGHEDAMSDLRMHLARILGPTKEGDGVILFGPRGNGKTTLLNELESLAQGEGVNVRHLTTES